MSDDHKAGPGEPFGGFGRTFGRREGRPLRGHHAGLMLDLLPQIEIRLPRSQRIGDDDRDLDGGLPDENIPSEDINLIPGDLDPHSFFQASASAPASTSVSDVPADRSREKIWLEIGFGSGEHLAGQAANNPDIGFIGGEFFTAGVGRMLSHIDAGGLENVRLFKGDARQLLANLSPASLSRVFVLYPDPWPKTRHARRRMISPWSVNQLARVVKPGGEVRVVSDIPAYCRWTLKHFGAEARFSQTPASIADSRTPPRDWVPTRYEAKAHREGRTPAYLDFQRL